MTERRRQLAGASPDPTASPPAEAETTLEPVMPLDAAVGGGRPSELRAATPTGVGTDLSEGPVTVPFAAPLTAPERPAAPRPDPEWEAALTRARWIARLGLRKRRPDGTREDWLEPAQRAELERRGRLRLGFYKAADAFAAREGRAPDKPEQRRLLAQLLAEEEMPQGRGAAGGGFAQSDPSVTQDYLRRVVAAGPRGAETNLRPDAQFDGAEVLRAPPLLASADGEERDPFSQSRRAGEPEIEQEKTWRSRAGQDPDKLLPASARRRAMQEIERRLEEGKAEGLTPRQVADSLTDPAEVANYAVTLAGRTLGPDQHVFLEALLTGRTARNFLADEARRMANLVQVGLDKLPPDIWKQLRTSWPALSPAERHAALRRVTTQVALELGVRGATLRSYSDFSDDSRGMLAFILPNIDVNLRQQHVADAAAGTNNAFLGILDDFDTIPVDIMMLAVAEEAVHLAQRQTRAEFEEGQMPSDSKELTRLSLLSANAVNYYSAADGSNIHNPDMFRRYLMQPMEFEVKVIQHVLASRGYARPEEVARWLLDNNRLVD